YPSARRSITRKVKLIFAGARSHRIEPLPRVSPHRLFGTKALVRCRWQGREVQLQSFSESPADLQGLAPCPGHDSIESAPRSGGCPANTRPPNDYSESGP